MDAVLVRTEPVAHSSTSKDAVAEANHRIANSLTLLVSMVRMQSGGIRRRSKALSNGDVCHLLDGIAARITTIGHLHRLLSSVPLEGATAIRPHLREVTDALVAALSAPGQEVRVNHTGQDCLVLTRQVQPLVLILCEIFINAMKYAHPAGAPLTMTVDCTPSPDGRLVITIADDGVGLPEDFDHVAGGGLGFRVIRSLAGEIGGALSIESDPLGLSFALSLPAAAMSGTN